MSRHTQDSGRQILVQAGGSETKVGGSEVSCVLSGMHGASTNLQHLAPAFNCVSSHLLSSLTFRMTIDVARAKEQRV